MNAIDTTGDDRAAGTLLWIGDRHSPEFQEPFQYCESHAAQLALRSNLEDAIGRRAIAVRCILITRGTRQPLDSAAREALVRRYPNASVIDLLGTLCEGERSGYRSRSTFPAHYWYEWNQLLPEWLRPCSHCGPTAFHNQPRRSARSVAVLASSASTADPLMELATSAGAAIVWCRKPDLFRARNFDAIWWDDSVAAATTATKWRERLSRAGARQTGTQARIGGRQQHAWIVQSPRIESYRQAKQGGVDLILSKPGQIECLSEMLATAASTQRIETESDRRARAA